MKAAGLDALTRPNGRASATQANRGKASRATKRGGQWRAQEFADRAKVVGEAQGLGWTAWATARLGADAPGDSRLATFPRRL